MSFGELFKAITEIGQSTNGGFTLLALVASTTCWLLYRGTRATLAQLQVDLKACNEKHELTDKQIATVYEMKNNLAISCASLWTLINMSGDRRNYQLPPLNEVLEGRMIIQIRAETPEQKPGERRTGVPPLLSFQDEGGAASG